MIQVSRKAILAAILAVAFLGPPTLAESGTIEEIHVQGLFRMTREAFLHAVGLNAGDTYDETVLRSKFYELWDMGLFDEIAIESEDGPDGGKIVVFKVRERPVLSSITYGDNRVLSRTQIEDRLREKEIKLRLGRPLDRGVISTAEAEIRNYLAEKGHLDGEVKADIREVTQTSRAVHFDIRTGGKTRIKAIRFEGNEVFSNRKLKKQLELTEARRWYWPWSGKNLYHPFKWDQDVGNIRDLYQNLGYLDIDIKPPVIEVKEKIREPKKKGGKKGGEAEAGATEPAPSAEEDPELARINAKLLDPELPPKKREKLEQQAVKRREKLRKKELAARRKAEPKVKKRVFLTVPVSEGEQYTTGEITITGNQVYTDEEIRVLVPLRKGGILRNGLLEMTIEAITRRYEDRGHLYATVVRKIERRPDEKVADVEIVIEEDEPYYISRIEFSGNTSTQDRVLRREVLLNEGQLFNRTRLNLSKIKINQLGYFETKDEPVIEPVEGESRVKVTFSGEERGRNEIQVGGGYSGYDGAFFTGVYSTRNFLGRGQVLSTSMQVGGRTTRYQINFQEPWFLNRPYVLGFSLFRRDIDYGDTLQSSSEGGGILLGKQIKTFSSVRLSYAFESVSSSTLGGTSTAQNKISSLTPIYTYDRVNNPYRPSAGSQLQLSFQVAGGPLGGDTSFLKPITRYTTYRKGFGRTFFALHGELGLVREWQDGSPLSSSTVNGIPRYQRFWLGGDTIGPRVFEVRTITPLRYVTIDENNAIDQVLGDPRYMDVADFYASGSTPILLEVGGDRYFLLQSELVFPLNQQAEVALFLDAGDALFEDQSWGFDTARVSAGVELRFHLPVFPVPLRLIYGWPIREMEGDRTSRFTFSIGRSF